MISLLIGSEKKLLDDSLIWNKINNNNKVDIYSTNYNNISYCKAVRIYNSPSDKIKFILDDKLNYTKTFNRIEEIRVLSENVVYIKLDLPFPFLGRDYIVRYKYQKNNNFEYYTYKATDDFPIKVDENYVRLVNAYGIWKIEPIDENRTKLTHIWNGDLRGNFPDFALKQAWRAQGYELLESIEERLNMNLN